MPKHRYRRIGFTGTQHEITEKQRQALRRILPCLRQADMHGEFHHGDCVGADAAAHDIAVELDFDIIVHPPVNPSKRAFKTSGRTIVLKPFPYLKRNKCIVNATEILVATPLGMTEELRSGTWSTIRFARKIGRPRVIIFPDGSVSFEAGREVKRG